MLRRLPAPDHSPTPLPSMIKKILAAVVLTLSSAAAFAVPFGSQSVLVVEDEPGMRELIRLVLVRAGHEVVAVAGPHGRLTIAAAADAQLSARPVSQGANH